MKTTDLPDLLSVIFAQSASGSDVTVPFPSAPQTGGKASLTTGFPDVNFQPIASGGIPPWGADMNGILQFVTKIQQWMQGGGSWKFDSGFSTAIGGYWQGARLQSSIAFDRQWISLVDDNTVDPDSYGQTSWGAANWLPGDKVTTPDGGNRPGLWCLANAQTIGDVGSGATIAAAYTKGLYRFMWLKFSNSQCPVTGGRGANPDADFAAGKPIGVFDARGRGEIFADTMGNTGNPTTRLSGVPVVSGSTTVPGSLVGENLHVLAQTELPAVPASGSIINGSISNVVTGGVYGGINNNFLASGGQTTLLPWAPSLVVVTSTQAPSTFVGNNLGSSQGHNTVQQSIVENFWWKF